MTLLEDQIKLNFKKLVNNISDKPNSKSTPNYTRESDKTNIINEQTNVDDSDAVDVLTNKIKYKLGIITPEKPIVKTTTPRRKLAEIDEENEDVIKTPRKSAKRENRTNIQQIQISPSVSARPQRNTPRRKLTEITDDEDAPLVKTPRKYANTPLKNRTPSHTKVTSLTPKVESRANELSFKSNDFELARSQLSASLQPGSLPCREKEFNDIYGFVHGKLMDNTGGCMYISGVPGTGKTATVCGVMNLLNEYVEKNKVPSFNFIKLNALSLPEPRQVYVEIAKQIANRTVHWEEGLTMIQKYFKKKTHKLHVMLVDELDKLCTRKQEVVYNLLDLPANSKTPVVVITIANTMDLPERLLSNKVNSRLGLTRLTFQPYKHREIIGIVKIRLAQYNSVFRNEALEYISRKVAAVSGDARRALAICSRATEIAETSEVKEITMNIVNKTLEDMASSFHVKAVKYCSKLEKKVLQAMISEVTRTGNDEVPFENLISTIDNLCILDSVEIPNVSRVMICCHKLHSYRLIIMKDSRYDVSNTLMLNISVDDVHYALQDK